MLPRSEFLQIVAEEGLTNPRTGAYSVRALSVSPVIYPYVFEGRAMPAVAMQFAVEHNRDDTRRRVVTLARGPKGYAIWCGDAFTEGRFGSDSDVRELIFAACSSLPNSHSVGAFKEMRRLHGSYPHHAHCHFWEAWESHRGLCKHVAAALQVVEHEHGAVEKLLNKLDWAYFQCLGLPFEDELSSEATTEELRVHFADTHAVSRQEQRVGLIVDIVFKSEAQALDIDLEQLEQEVQAEKTAERARTRGAVYALFAEVAGPAGGMKAEQYSRLQQLIEQLSR